LMLSIGGGWLFQRNGRLVGSTRVREVRVF